MRLPHHLVWHPSGLYHFRLVVPLDLRAAIGLKVIKQSLRTRDSSLARGWAYLLSAQYAQAFAEGRKQIQKASDPLPTFDTFSRPRLIV